MCGMKKLSNVYSLSLWHQVYLKVWWNWTIPSEDASKYLFLSLSSHSKSNFEGSLDLVQQKQGSGRVQLHLQLNSKTVPVLPSLDPSLIFPFHLLLSSVHPTRFSFCFFPDFLAILILLPSNISPYYVNTYMRCASK